MTSVFAFNVSEPKHVIKNLRFLSISQIKLFENETNSGDYSLLDENLRLKRRILFILFQIIKEPSNLCAFDCTTDAGNISSRFSCLLPYPFNGKFAIGLRSKDLKGAKCKHLLPLYPWIVVASIGLVSSYVVHDFIWLAVSLQRTSRRSSWLTSSLIYPVNHHKIRRKFVMLQNNILEC